MNYRFWMRLLLILPLLVSGLTWSGVQAADMAQAGITDVVIWCPSGVGMPIPNKSGCTDAFPTLTALAGALTARNPSGAGTIWIGKDFISDPMMDDDQLWDGSVLTNMANSPLTIKGGWNGLGKGTLDVNTRSTLEGASWAIQNWKGAVSISNLRIQNATSSFCQFNLAALCVLTDGRIKLERVDVLDNDSMNGVYLDNDSSTSSPPAAVLISNSQFNGSSLTGLLVFSKGTITLNNTRAERNTQQGALVYNLDAPGNVVLKGTNVFLGNGREGLCIRTSGSVTASHLVAYFNGATTNGSGVDIRAQKAVTITGSGKFKGNGFFGLYISTAGPITARNLTASSNAGDGLSLLTSAPADTQAVTLSGVNADLNLGTGLEAYTDGRISLSCSSTYGNTGTGLYVRSRLDPMVPAASLKLVGFFSYGNGTDKDTLGTPETVAPCP